MKAKITKAQETFLRIETRGGVYKGGIGAGKSYILSVDALMRATKGLHVAIVSFSYPSLRDTVLVTLKGVLEDWGFRSDVHYEFIKSEMSFEFPDSGGKIILRSGDRPDALRGLNLNFFYVDEAREFPDDALFRIMIGRLRRAGARGWRISSTTKGKSWFWKLEQQENCTVVKQTTMANPFLPQDYIDELLASYTSEFARQELYAEEVTFGAGIIKPHWLPITDKMITGERVISIDLAVSIKKEADYTAIGLICVDARENVQVQEMHRLKMQWMDLKNFIINIASLHEDVPIVIEEAGQMLPLIEELQSHKRIGSRVKGIKPKGDKFARAQPWIARAEQGKMSILRAAWNDAFVDEAIAFTQDDSHGHDDQLDSVSQGHKYLQQPQIGFA